MGLSSDADADTALSDFRRKAGLDPQPLKTQSGYHDGIALLNKVVETAMRLRATSKTCSIRLPELLLRTFRGLGRKSALVL